VETGRLIGLRTVLRRVEARDLPILQAWDEDPEIEALMGRKFVGMAPGEWFCTLAQGRSCRAWVIESQDGTLIGELELAQLNWRAASAELRVCIGERSCWNQGFGTDAISTALAASFDQIGLRSVYLRVFASNARAVRVYEKLGFRKQAILQPSARREDPSAVILMNLTREAWYTRQQAGRKLQEGLALSLTSHG
jgi:RimJ/RimL family protein N-acetyltransferase